MAIAKYAKNKGTAVEFAKWWTSAEEQKAAVLVTSQASAVKSVYTDPEIVEKFPFMDVLLEVDRIGQATAQGRQVRRRYPGHPGCGVQRPPGAN